MRWTWCGKLLYRYGKAILYSVLMGWRIMILLMSLNSFQSSSLQEKHKKSGCMQNKSSEWIVDATKRGFYFVMSSQLWKIRSLIKRFAKLHLKVIHHFIASFLELFSWPICFICQNTYWRFMSLTRGSNFGPPGMAMLRALEVKKALRSNR